MTAASLEMEMELVFVASTVSGLVICSRTLSTECYEFKLPRPTTKAIRLPENTDQINKLFMCAATGNRPCHTLLSCVKMLCLIFSFSLTASITKSASSRACKTTNSSDSAVVEKGFIVKLGRTSC